MEIHTPINIIDCYSVYKNSGTISEINFKVKDGKGKKYLIAVEFIIAGSFRCCWLYKLFCGFRYGKQQMVINGTVHRNLITEFRRKYHEGIGSISCVGDDCAVAAEKLQARLDQANRPVAADTAIHVVQHKTQNLCKKETVKQEENLEDNFESLVAGESKCKK